MKFKVQQKQYLVIANQLVSADGFSSWRVINQGEADIVINDTITVAPGQQYSVDVQPYVTWDTSINVKFSGEGAKEAVVVLFYNSEV